MPARSSPPLIIAEAPARYRARPPLVVDCSVLVAMLFYESNRDVAVSALSGMQLFAPELLADEFVSVAVKKSRHGEDEVVRQALVDFADLKITRRRCDVRAQWRLALEYGLSGYDAAYLWLAAELNAPLATFDERLGTAARKLLGRT